jgi:dephospho-CoA kinase
VIAPEDGWPTEDDGGAPVLVGLTGPIGCGKSTVAGFLRDIGGEVIDADQLSRQATAPGAPALTAIRERFGDGVFGADGALDRQALAKTVFADAEALADLEQIVHPQVRLLVEQRLAAAAKERVPFAVIEAIKLVEGGLADGCAEVWIVDCSAATQRARLYGRGATGDDIERRLAAQGDDLAKRLAAQLEGRVRVRVLITDGSLDETRERVEDALAEALDRPV